MRTRKRIAALTIIAGSGFLAAANLAHAGSSVAVAAESQFLGCTGPVSNVEIVVAVTAGSAAPFTMMVSTGGDFASLGAFFDWTSNGRAKAAVESFQAAVPPGPSQITICVAQPGANGNDSRQACTAVAAPPPCDGGSGSDGV